MGSSGIGHFCSLQTLIHRMSGLDVRAGPSGSRLAPGPSLTSIMGNYCPCCILLKPFPPCVAKCDDNQETHKANRSVLVSEDLPSAFP